MNGAKLETTCALQHHRINVQTNRQTDKQTCAHTRTTNDDILQRALQHRRCSDTICAPKRGRILRRLQRVKTRVHGGQCMSSVMASNGANAHCSTRGIRCQTTSLASTLPCHNEGTSRECHHLHRRWRALEEVQTGGGHLETVRWRRWEDSLALVEALVLKKCAGACAEMQTPASPSSVSAEPLRVPATQSSVSAGPLSVTGNLCTATLPSATRLLQSAGV